MVNRAIYSEKALKQAIKDYLPLALIEMNSNADKVNLTFSNCKYDEEKTIREFENYLIGIENTC